jgi:hypothetical protein
MDEKGCERINEKSPYEKANRGQICKQCAAKGKHTEKIDGHTYRRQTCSGGRRT